MIHVNLYNEIEEDKIKRVTIGCIFELGFNNCDPVKKTKRVSSIKLI